MSTPNSPIKKFSFTPAEGALYRFDYARICGLLNDAAERGDEAAELSLVRSMALTDLFFMIYFILDVKAVNHPWVVARIYEVQDKPNGHLDLWAREHFKSTILTYGLIIFEVMRDPEQRIAIISNTRSVAKAFLQRIKVTFETNDLLRRAFSDVLYDNPDRESPKWALDAGLVLKRRGVYLESTIEACGVLDGMPAGKHFTGRVYDDLVTELSVTTPEMIQKTLYMYQLSLNIGAEGGWERMIGTIYHYADLYRYIIENDLMPVRKYPCIVDGRPVLRSAESLADKRKKMGPYVFACQMMLDPVSGDNQVFHKEWLRFFQKTTQRLNYYIIVDPASKKKVNSDYTTMWVIGVDASRKKYIVDGVHDRLSLKQRWTKLRDLYVKWNPMGVGYEQYGMQSDIEYIEERQEIEGISFPITALGGMMSKEDRIRRLVPQFEDGQIMIPRVLMYTTVSGDKKDLVQEFIKNEYLAFPYSAHDDMLDDLARILDEALNVLYPSANRILNFFRKPEDPLEEPEEHEESWMSL